MSGPEGAHASSGDGWVDCRCGQRHWGTYGAAGLLLHADGQVLLQHRALWSHQGGTWGVPGGARHPHESAVGAALREAAEEAGPAPGEGARLLGELTVDHGDWSYVTVLADTPLAVPATPRDAESLELRWVAVEDVAQLPLHTGFASAWPGLRPALGRRLCLVVDGANVVGSRPDGWWRDRAAAAGRLRQRLEALPSGLDGAGLPVQPSRPRLTRWYPDVVLVVEGAARTLPDATGTVTGTVTVVPARGSGDDALVQVVDREVRAGKHVVAVTADRELKARVGRVGGVVSSPRWLLDLLPEDAEQLR